MLRGRGGVAVMSLVVVSESGLKSFEAEAQESYSRLDVG